MRDYSGLFKWDIECRFSTERFKIRFFKALNVKQNRKKNRKKKKIERQRRRRNRSLEKCPYPILSGFVLLSRKRWSRIIPKEWRLLAASSESVQRVRTVVRGRSVKCNAIFSVWIFAVVDLFSVWILHISNIWKYHVKVRTTNTHSIVLYAKIWLPGRKRFGILRLS